MEHLQKKKKLFSIPQQPIPRLPLCFASSFHILGNRLLLGIVGPQPARILGCVSGSAAEKRYPPRPVSLTSLLCQHSWLELAHGQL